MSALVLPRYAVGPVSAAAKGREMELVVLSDQSASSASAWRGDCHLYGPRLLGDIVAAELALVLTEPPAAWLTSLPFDLVRRNIWATTLGDAWQLRRPLFIKPADGKRFQARVYPDGSYLPGPDALPASAPVLVAERVMFKAEFRLFVLDGKITTGSRYATDGTLDLRELDEDPMGADAVDFGEGVLRFTSPGLPSALTLDVGVVTPGPSATAWAVVEANAAWSSGSYAASAGPALDAVLRSAGPRSTIVERDLPFLRII